MNEIEEKIIKDPKVCPYCNSNKIRITYNSTHTEGSRKHISLSMACSDCKLDWELLYRIAGAWAPTMETLMEQKL